MSKTNTIRLKLLGLPVMETIDDFATLTHLSRFAIYQLSYHADKHYKTYDIPKKNGSIRAIAQPGRKLKALQAWILVHILNRLNSSASSKGFEKGTSIYDNAKVHIGAAAVLTVDLKDFFHSISQRRVFNIFKTVGYNDLIATTLANTCTFEGRLPQGSPCSPKLANLSVWQMDARLQGYVGKKGINYSRYADDLTFSGMTPAKVAHSLPFIKRIVQDEQFQIHPAKTRLAGPKKAKIVTGLVVLNDTVGIGTKVYKRLRAKIFTLSQTGASDTALLNEVRGWLAYTNSVDTKRFRKAMKYVDTLKIKYPGSRLNEISWKDQ